MTKTKISAVADQPDIQVFNQTDTSLPFEQSLLSLLAAAVADKENAPFSFVEVVYVDEDEIVRINREHLNRDYVTDIISFHYTDPSSDQPIEGTLYCCAPRIFEQAEEFGESPKKEFLRIFVHGLLHLVGYEDQSDQQKQTMTEKENTYLAMAEPL